MEQKNTVEQFIAKWGLKLEASQIAQRSDSAGRNEKWDKEAFHFKMKIYSEKYPSGYSFEYSMGSGHAIKKKCCSWETGAQRDARGGYFYKALPPKPELARVLECLQWECTSETELFEDFCAELGYEEDSRSAYTTWETINRQRLLWKKAFPRELTQDLAAVEW